MGGLELMLKSMGFDPEEFKGFLTGMQTALQKFNADLDAIKAKQVELEQNQRAILAAVVKPELMEATNG